MPLMLFSAFDADYYRWGICLIESFRMFNDGRVAIYGVNLTPEQRDGLASIPKVELIHEEEESIKQAPTHRRRRYVCTNRHRVLLNVMENETDPILLLDADSIVRQNLERVGRFISEHDISLRIRRGKNPVMRVYGGIYGVVQTSNSIRFMRYLSEHIDMSISDQWWLFNAYEQFKGQINIGRLETVLTKSRRTLAGDTMIWTGRRGNRSNILSKFQELVNDQ